jgi:prepilin-type N-terminal cleavage/methylation domain-containing protein
MTPRRPSRFSSATGFTLVELLVAAVVMVLASAGGSALFNQATRQAAQIRLHLEQQFAIASDLSAILELNDRYSCATGTCVVAEGAEPPNQGEYMPVDPALAPALCAPGLSTDLVARVNGLAALGGGIQRTAQLDPSAGVVNGAGEITSPPHRYLVSWSQGTTTLRQVQLVPTVAAWCP